MTPNLDRLATWQGLALGLLGGATFLIGFLVALGDATWLNTNLLEALTSCGLALGVVALGIAVFLENRDIDLLEEELEIEDATEQIEILDNPLLGIARLTRHINNTTHVALIPIRPTLVDRIRQTPGTKAWRIIRRNPIRDNTTHVAIYETSPAAAIVAIATIKTLTNPPKTKNPSRKQTTPDTHITLSDITWLHPPIDRTEIDMWHHPTSVRYLTNHQTQRLTNALAATN